MIALITSALSLLALILEMIAQNRQTAQEKRYEQIQAGRTDIADGDAVAVDARIDQLLSVSEAGDHNAAGQPGSEVTPGRLSAILGVAAAGRGTGQDTGDGGSVPGQGS